MSKSAEELPRPASELEALADYYEKHDTADEMEGGRWVQPMVTTSLRLPRELFEQLKESARREGKRHTAYIREILECSVHGDVAESAELRQIQRKLDVLLQAVTSTTQRSTEPRKPGAARRKRTTPTTKKVKRSA